MAAMAAFENATRMAPTPFPREARTTGEAGGEGP